jgi:hypothetical protein
MPAEVEMPCLARSIFDADTRRWLTENDTIQLGSCDPHQFRIRNFTSLEGGLDNVACTVAACDVLFSFFDQEPEPAGSGTEPENEESEQLNSRGDSEARGPHKV